MLRFAVGLQRRFQRLFIGRQALCDLPQLLFVPDDAVQRRGRRLTFPVVCQKCCCLWDAVDARLEFLGSCPPGWWPGTGVRPR